MTNSQQKLQTLIKSQKSLLGMAKECLKAIEGGVPEPSGFSQSFGHAFVRDLKKAIQEYEQIK